MEERRAIRKYLDNIPRGETLPAEQERKFTCSLCQDRGIILKGETAYPCRCMKQKVIAKRFRSANLSELARRNTFESFSFQYYSRELRDPKRNLTYFESAQRAYRAARNFVQNCLKGKKGKGLFFCGPVGSGKTFLGSAIANALLAEGKQVLFTVVPDLLDTLKATYSRRSEQEFSEFELLDTARNAEILILDDLGAHNYTNWTCNKIYSLLNYRLNYQLPTVITTNLELEELEEYLGERTVSRILQLCDIYHLLVEKDIRHQLVMER